MALRLWDDDNDYVIAKNAEEAMILWCEHMGTSPAGYDAVTWEAWDDARVFTYVHEDGREEKKTAAEWCAERGKGYFASRDY